MVLNGTASTVISKFVPSSDPGLTYQMPPASGDTAEALVIVTLVGEMYAAIWKVPLFAPFAKPVNWMLFPTMPEYIPDKPVIVAKGVAKAVMLAVVPTVVVQEMAPLFTSGAKPAALSTWTEVGEM